MRGAHIGSRRPLISASGAVVDLTEQTTPLRGSGPSAVRRFHDDVPW